MKRPSLQEDWTGVAVRAMRKAGIPVTLPRLTIWTLLAQADGPLSVNELQHRLLEHGTPLPLSSIYTTLKRLVDSGILMLHAIEAGKSHYSLADSHFRQRIVCEDSGQEHWVADAALSEAIAAFCHRHGFALSGYTLTVQARRDSAESTDECR